MRKFKICLLGFFLLLGVMAITIPAQAASPKIRLNVSKLNIAKDSEYMLRIYNAKKKYTATFSLSDDSILSFVSKNKKQKKAKIKTLNIGSCVVTVTVRNKNKTVARLRCVVNVRPQAISIKLPKEEVMLAPGEMLTLRPILKPNTSVDIPIYTVSNPLVATINSKGKITAIAPGTTEIIATLPGGQTAKCMVLVTEIPDKPEPEPTANAKVGSKLDTNSIIESY